jgi:hypothetical protein
MKSQTMILLLFRSIGALNLQVLPNNRSFDLYKKGNLIFSYDVLEDLHLN